MNEEYVNELDERDLKAIEEYKQNNKISGEFLPFTVYRLIQCGYPVENHGKMVAVPWGGTDSEGKLIPPKGDWCKVSDIIPFLRPAPSVETVSDWENRTGRKYPDNGPVWIRREGKVKFRQTQYNTKIIPKEAIHLVPKNKHWFVMMRECGEFEIYVASPDHTKPEEMKK